MLVCCSSADELKLKCATDGTFGGAGGRGKVKSISLSFWTCMGQSVLV